MLLEHVAVLLLEPRAVDRGTEGLLLDGALRLGLDGLALCRLAIRGLSLDLFLDLLDLLGTVVLHMEKRAVIEHNLLDTLAQLHDLEGRVRDLQAQAVAVADSRRAVLRNKLGARESRLGIQ